MAQGNHPDFRLLQPDALAEEGGEAAEAGKRSRASRSRLIRFAHSKTSCTSERIATGRA
jgi:hypothetical protein